MRTFAVIAGAVVLVVLTFGVWLSGNNAPATAPTIAESRAALDTAARAPDNVRIRVRVLNGAGVTGLARRGTQVLRDHGYDVVDYTNAPAAIDSTTIDLNPAAREHGERLRLALGGTARIRQRETPLPYVDVVVTLGPDWKPTTRPFRP